jgi:hypothetical protein
MRKLHYATSCGLVAALAIGFVAGAFTGSSITRASAAGGGYYNPSVVTEYLNKMIPFKY